MEAVYPLSRQLAIANENAWLALGKAAEVMGDDDTTIKCYERAISHNRMNASTLFNLACYYEKRESYANGAEHFRALVAMNNTNGEAWSHLGYCLVQLNDLVAAYAAYQHALYHVQKPGRDSSLWYGIGLLYERYGSLDFAEDTFQAVLKMDPPTDIAWESKFRLAVIYKQRGKYDEAIDRLRSLAEQTKSRENASSVWAEIASIHELKNEIQAAKTAYQKVIEYTPHYVKAYQQLGWLCLKTQTDTAAAIDYLKQAVAADPKDGKGWYLLGRCYMSMNECEEAYYAYKEALALDANNPNIWCSLGVLFYQLGQYLDALDAYSRAINANPNICEVWYNVGTLYDTCNQTTDARDAYQKAAELGADAQFIRERLEMLRGKENGQTTGNSNTPPPSEPPTAAPMQSTTKPAMYNGSLPGQLTATPATSSSLPITNNRLDRQPPPSQPHLTQQIPGTAPSNWRMVGSGGPPNMINRTPISGPIMMRGMPGQQSHLQTQSSRGMPPIPGMMNMPPMPQRPQLGQHQQRMPLLTQQIPRKLVPDEIKRYNEDNRVGGIQLPTGSRLSSMDPQILASINRDQQQQQQRDSRLSNSHPSDRSPIPGLPQHAGSNHMKMYKVSAADG